MSVLGRPRRRRCLLHAPRGTYARCIRGEEADATDEVLKGVRDQRTRQSVILDFDPLKGARGVELAARFDIVLGLTAQIMIGLGCIPKIG